MTNPIESRAGARAGAPMRSANVVWHEGSLTREERWSALGRGGATVWLTGLPAAGKSELAEALEASLLRAGRAAYRLDSTTMRQGVCSDLGYGAEDRRENNRRLAELAKLFADAGTIAIVAAVSPFADGRQAARDAHERDGLAFVEVFVNTPLADCVARDPYGTYRRAREQATPEAPGIDALYEPPAAADVEVTPDLTTEQAVDRVADALLARAGLALGR
ncbi:adenylyl-sulfate kinase [Conexibacter arvalis]|uniref:Adenylyl-sulfate kinase n=1 Tax=Conexibacter arvalis TaxID=912552 RepID=A0A840IDQ5_9ACTN|nr:adenylyl-sulfate kinase [Conexibacter arvalis]MBB4663097.1 adenylyl-sulfate kinase [Conexibacter arvalis]